MKMDKFCMMFFVIVASIFLISGSASAQAADCIECSSCTLFDMWKFICTFIGQICTMQGMPANFCLEQQEICEDNIDDLVTECRRICKNDCNEPENCTGGAPDGNCTAGENCPADATDCDDNICMEPTCTNGCGEVSVSSGSTDEACNATAGCTTPPCSCDGNGECIGENEGCNGGDPDGDCEAGENCPADATGCDDNICMEPTCTHGCGETPVSEGGTDEACYANTGCTTPPCSCDGHGNCATVPIPGCHSHGDPDWLEIHSLSTILAKEEGCTGDCGTEYLVELRNESHADCGDQAWVWLKDGQEMDIDKCYDAVVFEDGVLCGPVIDVTFESVSCPVCDGQMEECANSACEAANTNVPCACGGATADTDNPWCCAADNAVFSKDSTQEDCKESESCKDGNIEECLIKITHNNDGKYCVGDTMVATHEFYVDGALTDMNSYEARYYQDGCATYPTEECGPYTYTLVKIETGVYESTGIAGMYNGKPSVMGLGKRIMNIEAKFGNCEEGATTDYTIYKEDSDECKPENPEEMECDEVEGECRLWPGCNSGETVSPAQCGLFQVCCIPDGGGGTKKITVLSPNGGETCYIDEVCDFTWSSTGVTGTVKIDLYKGGNYYRSIDSSVPVSDRTTPRIIPTSIPAGNDYRVKITSNGDESINDISNGDFTISSGGGGGGCYDPDKSYLTGGHCTGTPHSGDDRCTSSTELIEYSCNPYDPSDPDCYEYPVLCDIFCQKQGHTTGTCEGSPAYCKCDGGGGGTTCEDKYDDGIDLLNYGYCVDSEGEYPDACDINNGYINEHFCENDRCNVYYSACPSGHECINGECVSGGDECTESDGGRNYETGSYCDGSPFLSGNDHCNTQTGELTEYYCVAGSDTCHAESVDCDTYCKNKGSTSGKCEGFPAACKCSGGETSCTSQGGKCMSAVSCQGCDGTQISGQCDSGECCKCTSGDCEDDEGGTCISPAQCDACGGTLISGYCASYPCCKCAGNK